MAAIAVDGVLALVAFFSIFAYPIGVLGMLILLWLGVPISIYFLYHRHPVPPAPEIAARARRSGDQER